MLTVLGLTAGSAITLGLQTKAQSSSTTNGSTTTKAQFDPSKGGHVGSNGTKEEILTGDTAEKVKAAALAAVSGGTTIQRVETDAEGAVYEAHMTKSDGSMVTVKLDGNFNVTGTETGHGGRGMKTHVQ